MSEEDKIEIGEYLRTIYGEIFKVFRTTKQNKKYVLVDREVDRNRDRDANDSVLEKKEIVKHSKNIIDLIKEGDYIQLENRGERFYEVTREYKGNLAIIDVGWNEYEEIDESYNTEIKAIVTKEQFKEMEYRI